MVDSQAHQDARQAAALGFIDAGQEIVCFLLAHAFQVQKIIAFVFQSVDITEGFEQAGIA